MTETTLKISVIFLIFIIIISKRHIPLLRAVEEHKRGILSIIISYSNYKF